MTTAGVSVMQGIELLRRNAPTRKLKNASEQIMQGLVQGQTFAEAMRGSGYKIPEFDTALIEAGESAGRLDQCFRILGDFYKERGSMASKVLSQLMYPLFLFHFAVLLFPISYFTDLILKGQTIPFIANKLTVLVPFYAAIFFLLWIIRSDRNAAIRNFIEQVSLSTPLIGGLRRSFSLARLCAALEALINAGVTIIEAWDLSARASGSPRIIRAVAEVRPRIVSGELPSEAIASQGIYPDLFVSSYRTGEMSGQLDEALRRLYRYYQEAATEGLNRFAEWLPRLIYFGVAIAIAFQIVSFYSGYFKQLNDVMGP
jgi:type II secretory pathway component PulF